MGVQVNVSACGVDYLKALKHHNSGQVRCSVERFNCGVFIGYFALGTIADSSVDPQTWIKFYF